MLGGDNAIRQHGTTCTDVVTVLNLHITAQVPLAGKISSWDPLGDTEERASHADDRQLY